MEILLLTALAFAEECGDFAFDAARGIHLKQGKPERVGQIFIVGTNGARDDEILHRVPLYSGAKIRYSDVIHGQLNLANCGKIQVDLKRGIWPRIIRMSPEDDCQFKDIVITVKE